jgi:2'-5' RNA ligase
MRLFTAIELPDQARAALASAQKRIVDGLGRSGVRLRLVRAEHLHVTLLFIGEVADERGANIVEAMRGELPQCPFRLVLGGIGAFPARGAPTVLFVDVLQGAREATALYHHLADRLAAVGVARESRPFHPHVTLGRWRESRASDRPRSVHAEAIATVQVAAATLFQSRLSSNGPAYTRLATVPLVCP